MEMDKAKSVALMTCPGCGMPVQTSKSHKCNWEDILVNSHLRCKELEQRELQMTRNWHRVTIERDEARLQNRQATEAQNELFVQNMDLLGRNKDNVRTILRLETERDDLHAQLAEQIYQVKLLNGIVTGMRYQVTVARNSVLLDVAQAVQAIHKEYGDNCTIDAVRTAIRKIRKQGDDENDR